MPQVAADFFNALTAVEMNDWYERNVGYRPQLDDPSMTDHELRLLCESVAYEINGELTS